MFNRDHPDRALAALVFVIAAVARMLYIYSVWDSPSVQYVMGDAQAYHERALEIVAGDWLGNRAFYQDPLYPYFLATLYSLFGSGSVRVLFVQTALGATTALMVFWIARALFGKREALLAGLFAALYPVSFYYEALLLKVSFSLFLTTAALMLCLRADRTSESASHGSRANVGGWLLAGFSFGLATLTRGNFLLFVPVLLAWVWWGQGKGMRRPMAIGAVTVGLALAILPVTLRNAYVSGDFVLITSQAGQNFYIGNYRGNHSGAYRTLPFARAHPRFEEEDMRSEAERRAGHSLSPSELSRFWFHEAVAEIQADPAHTARLAWRKLRLFTNHYEVPDNYSFDYFRSELSPLLRLPLLSWGILFPLALVGAFFVRANRRAILLTSYVATYLVSVVLFYTSSRYRMPVVPIVLVFAAGGTARIANLIREREWRTTLTALGFLALAWSVTHQDLVQDDLTLYRLKLGTQHQIRAQKAQGEAVELIAAREYVAADSAMARYTELFELAEPHLRAALEARPHNPKAQQIFLQMMVLRIKALEAFGNYPEALTAARLLTETLPNRSISWRLLRDMQEHAEFDELER